VLTRGDVKAFRLVETRFITAMGGPTYKRKARRGAKLSTEGFRTDIVHSSRSFRMIKHASPQTLIALAVTLTIPVGCTTTGGGYVSEAEATAACAERQDCDSLQTRDGVILTAAEACWVTILRQRCNIYDRCILSCLLNGEARDIAGGCWHTCGYIFVGVQGKPFLCPSSPVPGWDKCDEQAADSVAGVPRAADRPQRDEP